ncbi:transmembrane protein, putative [Medicago truncatula]|uniref:Transmembrane protein, putative n=1 Tax=Medicago truncatula TaxID=3880 RepID=A0A072UZT4_MEDTR|nr:transmembrane protein, putative [Medicago truncatula]
MSSIYSALYDSSHERKHLFNLNQCHDSLSTLLPKGVIPRILGASLVVPILQVNVIWGDERFIKTPSIGTSPSNLLKDKFNFIIYSSFSKLTGIGPVRLFDDVYLSSPQMTLTCKIETTKAAPRILAITPYFIEKIM